MLRISQEEYKAFDAVREKLYHLSVWYNGFHHGRIVGDVDEKILDVMHIKNEIYNAINSHKIIDKYALCMERFEYILRDHIKAFVNVSYEDIGTYYHNVDMLGEFGIVQYIVNECLRQCCLGDFENKKRAVKGERIVKKYGTFSDQYAIDIVANVNYLVKALSKYDKVQYKVKKINGELKFPLRISDKDCSILVQRNGCLQLKFSERLAASIERFLVEKNINLMTKIFHKEEG